MDRFSFLDRRIRRSGSNAAGAQLGKRNSHSLRGPTPAPQRRSPGAHGYPRLRAHGEQCEHRRDARSQGRIVPMGKRRDHGLVPRPLLLYPRRATGAGCTYPGSSRRGFHPSGNQKSVGGPCPAEQKHRPGPGQGCVWFILRHRELGPRPVHRLGAPAGFRRRQALLDTSSLSKIGYRSGKGSAPHPRYPHSLRRNHPAGRQTFLPVHGDRQR